MNTKDRVVYALSIAIILTLNGCFPWAEEKSIEIIEQPDTKSRTKSEATFLNDSLKKTHRENGLPHQAQTTISKDAATLFQKKKATDTKHIDVKSTKKPVSHRTRRRQRKKERDTVNYHNTSIKTPLCNDIPITKNLVDSPINTNIQIPVETADRVLNNTHQKQITEPLIVEVRNAIAIDQLAVKHWTGTYRPTKLDITINNVPFTIIGNNAESIGSIKKIPYNNGQLTVQYNYEFLNGMRKGADTVTYTINESTQHIPVRFSWDTAWHVELDGAQRQ